MIGEIKMKEFIQIVIYISFFLLVLRHYRRQPQPYLKLILIGLILIGATKGILPYIERAWIRYAMVIVTLLIGCISYYLLEKQDES